MNNITKYDCNTHTALFIKKYRIAENFSELDEVEYFARIKLSRIAEATPRMRTYVQKFADKTLPKGSYAAKFAKVFTRERFPLYGIN